MGKCLQNGRPQYLDGMWSPPGMGWDEVSHHSMGDYSIFHSMWNYKVRKKVQALSQCKNCLSRCKEEKIVRPCIIFIMGIPMLLRCRPYIETAPRL